MRTCHPPCGRWVAESLWATLITEYYYRRKFTTRDQVYTGITIWIEDFYNRRRIHTSLGGKSPSKTNNTKRPGQQRINKPSTTCAQAQTPTTPQIMKSPKR